MSASSSLMWGPRSNSDSKESEVETIMSSRSDFAFVADPDQISVSTIVEKLVTERLKLGIIKTAKGGVDAMIHASVATDVEKEDLDSLDESIPSLRICLDKFEAKTAKMDYMTLGLEPDEIPPNLIEPNFSESEDEFDEDYRDPKKDIHMMLNRSRSFYTPTGFKDSRYDLKRLENERERMWTQSGKDKYTYFLYEEALKPLKHIKIKGRIYDDDDLDGLYSRDDAVIKSIESLMAFIKPKELPPQEWDPGNLATEKYAPYWAFAPAHATDKTINKIRYIYKILKETDFHRQDPKMRRRTGRRLHRATEEVEESEESIVSSSEEESSDEEPYLLKRKDSIFLKRKVAEVVEEEEDIQEIEIKPGRHNLQVGHEISISTLQKCYPDTPESSETESDGEEKTTPMLTPAASKHEDRGISAMTTTTTTTSRKAPRSSWLKKDEIDPIASDESLYKIETSSKDEKIKTVTENKPYITMHKGFPVIRQRPKWITLQRECLEKEGEDKSLVERYRCLCLNRGIPPMESVARNVKKKTAIFNRMGRGPEDTVQTMAEVLGKQTTELDLTGVYMSMNDICHLGKALPRFNQLAKLKLTRTQLTADKLISLIKCLTECKQLCLLDVSYNSLRKLTSSTMKSLLPITTLSSLNLSHCDLGNDSFSGLCQLSGSLKALNVSWNRLNDPTGLKNLSNSFIKHRSQLRELRLSWNSIGGVDSARILSDMGRNLKHLVFLDISYNAFNAPDEMLLFKAMLVDCKKLKAFLLSGNPLGEGAADALLRDLEWSNKPALRLIDLGDLWIDKEIYQICKMFRDHYHLETRVGGIKGNINLLDLDMREPLMKRLNFLNTSKKKKKTLKDLGNAVLKLMEQEEATRVRNSRFKQFIIDEKFKVEEGLVEALSKALSDRHRMIDLQAVHDKYRALYPEEVKEVKKKKPKKKKMPEADEPIVELMEPKLEAIKSSTNVLFVKASKPTSALRG